MSGALLAAGVALLAWPAPRSGARRVRPGRPARPGRWRAVESAPLTAGAVAATAGLALGTPLVAALAGGCAALGARSVRAARRRAAADAELLALADALGVLAAELAAGRTVTDAARTAAASCPDPRAAARVRAAVAPDGPAPTGPAPIGAAPVDPAPVDPAPVDPGADPVVGRLRAAVQLSSRTGCPLVEVLAAVEDDLRARYRRALELRSATAGPRAAAVLLAGLPVLGLAMGGGVGAHPWTVLTTTSSGQVVLVVGVLLEVAGVAWVGRLLRAASADRHLAGGRGG